MDHILSDEAAALIESALNQGNHWVAYNERNYFLDPEDIHAFRDREAAEAFATNHASPLECYDTIYADSLRELFVRFSYGQELMEPVKALLNNKNSVMNEKNFDYLANQVKFTGFGEEHREELKQKLEKGEPEFVLFHQQEFGSDSTVATLSFKKSTESDLYFFNKYALAVKPGDSEEVAKQTFYINAKSHNITLKEAYNLMQGRAVHKELTNKEGQQYHAWIQLDFKNLDQNGNRKMDVFHENYGYDLEKALLRYPIKELEDPSEKEKLMESLSRGNRQAVTFIKEGKKERVFVEAVPKFKSVNLYDGSMKRVNYQNMAAKNGTEQNLKQESQKTKQAEGEDAEAPKQAEKKAKRNKQSQSM